MRTRDENSFGEGVNLVWAVNVEDAILRFLLLKELSNLTKGP